MESKKNFLFNKSNYTYLIIGVVLNVIGFLMMIGGGADSPNDFNGEELFSTMRITISPIIIVLGYVVIIYSIMKKPKSSEQEESDDA